MRQAEGLDLMYGLQWDSVFAPGPMDAAKRFAQRFSISNIQWKDLGEKGELHAAIKSSVSKADYRTHISTTKPREGGMCSVGSACSCGERMCAHAYLLVEHLRKSHAIQEVVAPKVQDDAREMLAWASRTAASAPRTSRYAGVHLGIVIKPDYTRRGAATFKVQPTLLQPSGDARPLRVENQYLLDARPQLSSQDFSDFAALLVDPVVDPYSNRAPVAFTVTSPAQEDAVERVLMAGNATLEKGSGKRLRHGPALPTEAVWMIDADGVQRLQLRAAGAEVQHPLIAHGVWYLDERTTTMGRLLIDPSIVHALASAPTLSRGASRRAVQAWPSGLPVPSPHDTTDIEDVTAAPVPRVRLRALRAANGPEQGVDQLEATRPVARLTFDYGGQELPAAAPGDDATIVLPTPQGMKRITRDKDAETTAVNTLINRGLTPMGPGWDTTGDMGLQGRSTDVAGFLNAIEGLRSSQMEIHSEDDFGVSDIDDDTAMDLSLEEDGSSAWFSGAIHITLDGRKRSLVSVVIGALSDPRFSLAPEKNEPADAMWTMRLENGTLIRLALTRLRTLLAPVAEWLTPEAMKGRDGTFRISRLQAAHVADETGHARADLLPELVADHPDFQLAG